MSFDPAASDNHVAAVVRDLREKKERAVRHAGSAAGQQRLTIRQTALQQIARIPSAGRRGISSPEVSTSRSAPRPARYFSGVTTPPRATRPPGVMRVERNSSTSTGTALSAAHVAESSVLEDLSCTVRQSHAVV